MPKKIPKPNRILFLDIDGVLLPERAYKLPNQTKPIVTIFDPCAVALLNAALAKQGRKIVLHSSWIRTKFLDTYFSEGADVVEHCIAQGIAAEHFHPTDPYCNRGMSYRYDRINEWLARHDEVDNFAVIDDVSPHADWEFKKHFVLTDFNEGITMSVYYQLCDGYQQFER